MKKIFIKPSNKTKGLFVLAFMGMLMTACTGESSTDEVRIKESEVQVTEVDTETNQISIDIQVSSEQLSKELMKDGYVDLEVKTHNVEATNDENSEGGKYDFVDTVSVAIEATDSLDVFPQTIQKKVEYKRDAASLEWVLINEQCTKWDVKHKKLGGTAWKMQTDNGEKYIRLMSTIEFFYPKLDPAQEEQAQFDTTIRGLLATVENGETKLERIHVTAGTVTATGIITLYAITGTDDGEAEIVLNDYQQIEKSELPFTEEEYNEVVNNVLLEEFQ